MNITGEGQNWEQGELTISIQKAPSSPGWECLENIASLPVFLNGHGYSNGRRLPVVLNDYVVTRGAARILPGTEPRQTTIRRPRNDRQRVPWPTWEMPSDQQVKETLLEITPYIRMIDPRIVDAIVKHNDEIQPFIDAMRDDGIRTEAYVWAGSTCLFPGIRRAVGKTDTKLLREVVPQDLRAEKQAIYIDDNSYAKEMWAYLLTNRRFANRGPTGYELAHLFHHKAESDTNTSDEIEGLENWKDPVSGFFTSAVSCAYIPKSLARVTDLNLTARRLIQSRVIELYHDVCEPLPPGCKLKKNSTDWRTSEFKWAPTVGYSESSDALQALLKFRVDTLRSLVQDTKKNAA